METIDKDITTLTKGVIVHCVNCRNQMGRGVASAIAHRWPEVKIQYHIFCSQKDPGELLGKYNLVLIDSELAVVNLFGQFNYGNGEKDGVLYANYNAIDLGFRSLREFLGDVPIYIPYKFACGLAGGDWDTVSNIIEKHFPQCVACKI